MKLKDTIIFQVINKINNEWINWEKLITISFLSNDMKEKYLELMKRRKQVVGF